MIVSRIVMEDHAGELFLDNDSDGGACARLVFYREASESPDERAA